MVAEQQLLLQWATDVHAGMNSVLGLLAATPMPDEYDDSDSYADAARAWCNEVAEAIPNARAILATLPPGDHDPVVMKGILAGRGGNERLLDYGGALGRLILKLVEANEEEADAVMEKILDLMLDHPVLLLDARARQLAASAATMAPTDAIGRLMAVNSIAHAIVADVHRASAAAERRRGLDFEALTERSNRQLADYDAALDAAEQQLKAFEGSLPEQPEADRPLLASIIPTYFEDLAAFRHLREAFASLPAIAAAGRTSGGYASKADFVYRAFRSVEDANASRAAQRAEMIRSYQAG